MKAVPAKVGAQPKQLAILGALVVILVVVYLINRNPSVPESAAASSPAAPATSAVTPGPAGPRAVPESSGPMPMQRASSRSGTSSVDDFRPSLKLPEGTDISRIDPTLKLDLLAKLRGAPMEGGSRSISNSRSPRHRRRRWLRSSRVRRSPRARNRPRQPQPRNRAPRLRRPSRSSFTVT